MWVAPWMSWIATGGVAVVKLQESSAAIVSGGSTVSWSVTCAATIVTVQVSPAAKLVSGSSVKLCDPPLTAAACAPLVPHAIVYQPSETSTGSLKPTVTFASTATSAAPAVGPLLVTAGAASEVCATPSMITPEPERPCASPIANGRLLRPSPVPGATVVANVNVSSPAVASPFVPSSKSCCVALPPIAVRSAVTLRPVLAGFVPGVTATDSVTAPPWTTVFGDAAPVPAGSVGVGVPHAFGGVALLRGAAGATAKSAPLLSVSVQPPFARKAALELVSTGVGALPSKKLEAP